MYLNECIELLEKEFPNNWSLNFVKKGKISEEKEEELLIKLTSPLESIYTNLNLSLISGEYICKEDFFEMLNSFKSKLDNIYLETEEFENKKINKWNDRIQFEFRNPIRECIQIYRLFIKRLINNLKLEKTKSFIIDKDDFDSKKHTKAEEKLQNLFHLNLILSSIDFQLSLSRRDLDDLIRIKHELSSEYAELDLSKILLEKTEFLINKINYRFTQNEANYYYEINFTTQDIREKFDIFDEYSKNINYHYKENDRKSIDFKNQISSIYQEQSKNGGVINSLQKYHTLIKYYKDDKQNVTRVINLIKKDFKKYWKQKSQSSTGTTIYDVFQKKALDISYNYMLNNVISILIKDDSKKFENYDKIKVYFEKTKTLQDNTQIKNYFSHLKYLEYLIELIKFLLKDRKNIKKVDKLLNEVDNNISSLDENYKWCYQSDFLAFQLDFEECLLKTNYDGQDINVFLNSSFILPIDYENVEKKIDNIKKNYEKYLTMVDIHKDLNKEMNLISENANKIHNAEKKNIEILSIFSAIVLFTMGNIQLFSKITDFNIALRFVLLFAYCLALFVLLIWFITRERFKVNKIPTVHWIIIGLYVLSTYLIFAMLKNFWPF